ncbi:hypothetical protein FHR81_004820 [Actinoalloteichus hoggarensis]|nr:hypothetical protein [Actinoalloteichus hoggarensis]
MFTGRLVDKNDPTLGDAVFSLDDAAPGRPGVFTEHKHA